MNLILSSSNASRTLHKSAKLIRNEFLDYFTQDLGHTFIRSSPVVPFNDHSVAFVNAGMNQFKGVFLDYYDPPAKKAVNSQKCIRISGKHNDLNIVGNDTYHHTFFEMLGNWSFGDYFKEEACHYAWDLLTKHYKINKEFLYVTYFGGDETLGLEPDLECKDIWLRIGIAKDKIVPFGLKENFWEMGVSGPCGPSTEIHIDYTKQSFNRSTEINRACSSLTELWNIVFIQYQRLPNGTIVPLTQQYVDTGMGLERLVALLQGKRSNYDTDIFQPLFQAIQEYTKAPAYKGQSFNDEAGLDNGYRVLADHARMISVALADGMIPEISHKLRRIIRRAIDVGEEAFKKREILPILASIVADNLGDVYPELQNNLGKVQKILRFEEELYKKIKSTSGKEWKKIVATRPQLATINDWTASGLVQGYKYLQEKLSDLKTVGTLTGDVAFKLYDTYGLSKETINELAEVESLSFDNEAFETKFEEYRNRSRTGLLQSDSKVTLRRCVETLERNGLPKTDDSFKYKCLPNENNEQFCSIDSKIVALLVEDNVILNREQDITGHNVNSNEIGIILEKTNCYSLEGGQESDKGSIRIEGLNFNINSVRKIDGYVIHFGEFDENDAKDWRRTLKVGDTCTVSIISKLRFGTMQHHTAAHLLNASMRETFKAVYSRNSSVLSDNLKFRYNTFNEKLSLKQLEEIEKRINNAIRVDVPVTTKLLNASELLAEDSVALIPNEIYPYTGIRLVEIDVPDLKSKEPCCGTHVSKTGMLERFCFLNYYSKGATNINVEAAVGQTATSAKLAGEKIESKISDLREKLKADLAYETFQSIRKEIMNELNRKDEAIPYIVKQNCLAELIKLNDIARARTKEKEIFRTHVKS